MTTGKIPEYVTTSCCPSTWFQHTTDSGTQSTAHLGHQEPAVAAAPRVEAQTAPDAQGLHWQIFTKYNWKHSWARLVTTSPRFTFISVNEGSIMSTLWQTARHKLWEVFLHFISDSSSLPIFLLFECFYLLKMPSDLCSFLPNSFDNSLSHFYTLPSYFSEVSFLFLYFFLVKKSNCTFTSGNNGKTELNKKFIQQTSSLK